MVNICQQCGEIIREGDYVQCAVKTYYHALKSAVTYALSRDMEAIPDTLAHVNCNWPQTGGAEGD